MVKKPIQKPKPKPKNPKDRAIRLLTSRERTVFELRHQLLQEGFLEIEVEEVLQWCQEVGYVNDQRTAKQWVEHRNRFKPMGSFGLKSELQRKGLADDIIADVVNSPDNEYKLAKELANKKRNSLAKLPKEKQYLRVGGLLNRRGFSWDIINRVLNEMFTSSLDTDL